MMSLEIHKRESTRNGLYISALGGRETGDPFLGLRETAIFVYLWVSSLGFYDTNAIAKWDAIFMYFSSGNSHQQSNLGFLK